MDTIRTLARNPGLALVPSTVIAAAIAMDQFNRGPSVSAMVLRYLMTTASM